jgi:hypothetical protein
MAIAGTRRARGTRERNVEVATPCSDDETDGNLTRELHELSPRGFEKRILGPLATVERSLECD